MKRILIVDDVRLMADIRTTPLGRSEVEIVPLRGGEDVVAKARATRPAFVLLEEGEFFPEAFEAARRLQEDPLTAEIPVLYIGLALHRDLPPIPGIAEFLHKPARKYELEQAILRMLHANARRTARRAVDVACGLRQDDRIISGRCAELSLGGAFVVFDRRPRASGRGILSLSGGRVPLELQVEVVREGEGRHTELGWGLRFTQVDPELGARLVHFMRSAAERRGQALEAAASEPTP